MASMSRFLDLAAEYEREKDANDQEKADKLAAAAEQELTAVLAPRITEILDRRGRDALGSVGLF